MSAVNGVNAVRIRRRIDSDTLHLPELKGMIGKDVEITIEVTVVVEQGAAAPRQDFSKLDELAGRIDFDFEAFENLRKISIL